MNPFTIILSEIIYRPIFNLLVVFLVLFQGNLWLAIIALTITVRLLLLKPALAWNEAQKQMTDIQPKLQEIQTKYKDNPQKLSEETMKLMKTQWAGPLKWCLLMLIQMPIFIWLFFVIRDFASVKDATTSWLKQIDPSNLYSFFTSIANWYIDPNNINHLFLWLDLFINWNQNLILAIIAWLLMYIQISMTMMNKPQTPAMPWMPDMSKFMGIMNWIMIFMIASFVLSMPAWIWVYIIISTLFGVLQYAWQYRELLKIKLNVLLSKVK